MKTIILWFVLALTMVGLVLKLDPPYSTLYLCFFAWFGGGVSHRAAVILDRRRLNGAQSKL